MPVYSGTVGAAGGNYDGTYDGHGPQAWTDLAPNSFFKDPNILIQSDDVARYKEDQDIWDLFRRPREVIYTEVHNSITYKYRLTLTFLVLPAGASALTLADTKARFLGNDGALVATSGESHATVAGVSLGKYFSVGVDSFGEAAVGPYAASSLASDAFVEATATAGDGIWVIRSGTVALDVGEAVAVGDRLTFSDAVAGEVKKAAHSEDTSIAEIASIAGDTYVGVAVSSGAATPLYALCEVRLPERLGDNTEGSHIPDASPAA